MLLRDAKKKATCLGCSVRHVRRTGEVRFSHPDVGRATHNCRRKDANKALKVFLKRVQEAV